MHPIQTLRWLRLQYMQSSWVLGHLLHYPKGSEFLSVSYFSLPKPLAYLRDYGMFCKYHFKIRPLFMNGEKQLHLTALLILNYFNFTTVTLAR